VATPLAETTSGAPLIDSVKYMSRLFEPWRSGQVNAKRSMPAAFLVIAG
jgi:hypothetical protein